LRPEAIDREQQGRNRDVRLDQHTQRDQRVFGAGLMHEKGDDEQRAGKQHAGYHPGIEPVKPVVLIEAGIDQSKTETNVDDAGDDAAVPSAVQARSTTPREGGGGTGKVEEQPQALRNYLTIRHPDGALMLLNCYLSFPSAYLSFPSAKVARDCLINSANSRL
jgi:hypothetical protein